MTNGEKYEDLFSCAELAIWGINRKTDKPTPCDGECHRCKFYTGNGDCTYSVAKFVEWYNSEYAPYPTLSKKDKTFLDFITDDDGVKFVRDCDGDLYMYLHDIFTSIEIDCELFEFIEPDRPIALEELKNMEVDDD